MLRSDVRQQSWKIMSRIEVFVFILNIMVTSFVVLTELTVVLEIFALLWYHIYGWDLLYFLAEMLLMLYTWGVCDLTSLRGSLQLLFDGFPAVFLNQTSYNIRRRFRIWSKQEGLDGFRRLSSQRFLSAVIPAWASGSIVKNQSILCAWHHSQVYLHILRCIAAFCH